jgi:hypothetical protein
MYPIKIEIMMIFVGYYNQINADYKFLFKKNWKIKNAADLC